MGDLQEDLERNVGSLDNTHSWQVAIRILSQNVIALGGVVDEMQARVTRLEAERTGD